MFACPVCALNDKALTMRRHFAATMSGRTVSETMKVMLYVRCSNDRYGIEHVSGAAIVVTSFRMIWVRLVRRDLVRYTAGGRYRCERRSLKIFRFMVRRAPGRSRCSRRFP